MSDDFPREELEAELWRLRSVEIDLDTLQVQVEIMNQRAEATEKAREILRKRAEDNEAAFQRAMQERGEKAKEVAKLQEELEKARAERDWAMRRLEEYMQAEHMEQTYGFSIAEKMPERTRKGWRLGR